MPASPLQPHRYRSVVWTVLARPRPLAATLERKAACLSIPHMPTAAVTCGLLADGIVDAVLHSPLQATFSAVAEQSDECSRSHSAQLESSKCA